MSKNIWKQTNKKVASKLWIMETIAMLKRIKSPELFLSIFSAKLLFFQLIKTKAVIFLWNKEIEKNKEKIEAFVWFLIRNYQQQNHSANSHAIWHAIFMNIFEIIWIILGMADDELKDGAMVISWYE